MLPIQNSNGLEEAAVTFMSLVLKKKKQTKKQTKTKQIKPKTK